MFHIPHSCVRHVTTASKAVQNLPKIRHSGTKGSDGKTLSCLVDCSILCLLSFRWNAETELSLSLAASISWNTNLYRRFTISPPPHSKHKENSVSLTAVCLDEKSTSPFLPILLDKTGFGELGRSVPTYAGQLVLVISHYRCLYQLRAVWNVKCKGDWVYADAIVWFLHMCFLVLGSILFVINSDERFLRIYTQSFSFSERCLCSLTAVCAYHILLMSLMELTVCLFLFVYVVQNFKKIWQEAEEEWKL